MLFGFVLALLVVAIVPGLDQPGRSPREALLLIAAPLLLGTSLLGARARPSAALPALLALAAAGSALSALMTPGVERLASLRDLALLAAPWGAALAASLHLRGDAGDEPERAVERALIFALTLVSLAGLAQAWWGWTGLPQAHAPGSTFLNRNVAAQALVALLPLLVPLALVERGWQRWGGALAGAAGLALLVATRSRGAALGALLGWGLAASVAVLVARRMRGKPWSRGGLWAGVVLAGGLISFFTPVVAPQGRLPSPVEIVGDLSGIRAASFATRQALLGNTLAMTLDHPLAGVGPGRFVVEYPRYQAARVATPRFGIERQPEHAHNDFLESASETGLPAVLALAFLLIGAVVRSVRQAWLAGTTLEAARCLARTAALSAMLVHGLVSFPLHSPTTMFLAWFLAGRAWSAGPWAPGRSPIRRGVAVALLFAVLPAAWIASTEMRARRLLGDGLGAHRDGDCATALRAADDAWRAAPWLRREVGMGAMLVFQCEKDAERSLVALERALAIHPHQLNLLLAAGARRLKAGRTDAATDAFAHAAEIAPRLGRAWLGLAMAHDAAGDREAAAGACDQALLHDPDFAPARAYCGGAT
jgi:O-antigen ligase